MARKNRTVPMNGKLLKGLSPAPGVTWAPLTETPVVTVGMVEMEGAETGEIDWVKKFPKIVSKITPTPVY